MSDTVLLLLGLGCSLYLATKFLWFSHFYPRYFSSLACVPGPQSGSLLWGNFLQIRRQPQGEKIREWAETIHHHGAIRYFDLLNAERLVVLSPQALAEVLVTRQADFEKPPQLSKSLSRILGKGLFLAEGEEHKEQRKALMPAFSFRHVKDLHDIFIAKCRQFIEVLKADVTTDYENGTPVDVYTLASRATLDIVSLAGLGTDFGALKDPTNEMHRTYQKIFSPDRKGQILGTLGFILPAWMVNNLPIKLNADMIHASRVIREKCLAIIHANSREERDVKTTSKNVISVALASKSFNDEMLAEQIMTFLLAGHETTSSALSWAVYAICEHDHVQRRLRDEIMAEAPSLSVSGTLTREQLDKMRYLHAVCNEVLRLFPPIPVTTRVAVRNTQILDYGVKQGTVVMISPWATNRSTHLWGVDAVDFNPDRWMDPKHSPIPSNFASLTFLQGPRNCIGSGFAKAELACLLASWVAAFDTSFADAAYNMTVKNGIASRPADLKVRLRRVCGSRSG